LRVRANAAEKAYANKQAELDETRVRAGDKDMRVQQLSTDLEKTQIECAQAVAEVARHEEQLQCLAAQTYNALATQAIAHSVEQTAHAQKRMAPSVETAAHVDTRRALDAETDAHAQTQGALDKEL
jgi:hypothetical protein